MRFYREDKEKRKDARQGKRQEKNPFFLNPPSKRKMMRATTGGRPYRTS
jgi:hypothetical protein